MNVSRALTASFKFVGYLLQSGHKVTTKEMNEWMKEIIEITCYFALSLYQVIR